MATNITDLISKISGEDLSHEDWNRLATAVLENQTDKMARTELNDAILLALAKARETGDFKGDKGDKGDKGEQGIQGVAGKDGVNGQNGLNGLDGRDGANGRDGTFATSYDPTTKTLSFTSALVNYNNEEF